ncbi:unnamed protein product [Rotaria socialis]|uniref:UBZ1-type domain-containing protein n=1 Tax=Rotaria socialis TaxID=392032 RepID=A0A818LNV9_9BILA|nr:unnamed protein product [Rotaria socialis]CAF4648743.1 unnamed protein product [Rotaria socialis]
MSYYKQLYPPPVPQCQSEMEIRNLFERHMKALLDQKNTMINEIIEWENNLIRQIQENVTNQKALVEQYCKYQLNSLRATCQEFLDTALIYEQNKNREEVRRLIEHCHSLKAELGVFDYPEQPIPFIKIQKEKQQVDVKQDVSITHKSNNRSTMNDDFRIDSNTNLDGSTSSISAGARTNPMNQQLLTTVSNIDYNQMMIDDLHRESDAIDRGDTLDKCPACCIIFSSTMDARERTQHVNQHFDDS